MAYTTVLRMRVKVSDTVCTVTGSHLALTTQIGRARTLFSALQQVVKCAAINYFSIRPPPTILERSVRSPSNSSGFSLHTSLSPPEVCG